MVRIVTPSLLALFQSMTEGAMDSTATRYAPGGWVDTGGGSGYYDQGGEEQFACRIMPLSSTKEIRDIVLTAGRREASGAVVIFYPMSVAPLGVNSDVVVNGELHTVTGTVPDGTYSVHRIALLRLASVGEEEVA